MLNKGPYILVIDDDSSTREILALVLENAGYEVQVSENFPDFKKIDSLPDLVIVDYNLGQKKGSEICKELKAGFDTSHIRVILISAMDNIRYIAADSCADDYIAKPFGIQLLLDKIEKALSVKEIRTSGS